MIWELERRGVFRAMIISILAALLWQQDRNERMKKTANFELSTDISWVKPCCLLCVIIRSDPLNANFTVVYKRRSVSRHDYVKDVVSTQDERGLHNEGILYVCCLNISQSDVQLGP